jgi:peptide deformylase
MRSILKNGDPLLNQKSLPVTDVNSVEEIVRELSETLTRVQFLYNFTRGSGISAPQIGYLSRISVVEFEGVRHVLINPEIVYHSPESESIREGCLSFFDFRGNVDRYKSVAVSALDESGKPVKLNANGSFAMLLQHEIDHLDGILYTQRLPQGETDLYPFPGMPTIP